MSLNLDKSTWKRVAFGDVVQNLNVTVRDPASEGIDRIIAMEHLDPGELKIDRWGGVEDGTTFSRRVSPGQTLFGKRRAYQRKAAFAEFDAICSGDILVFQADPQRLLAEMLPFLVQSNGFYDHALGTSAGSLSPRTNWRDLASYEFDLPPLKEQKRIADTMWALEGHRAALRTRSDALNAVLERMLPNPAQASAPGWELVPFSDAVFFQEGPGIRNWQYRAEGVPFVNIRCLVDGRLDRSAMNCLDPNEVDQKYQHFLLDAGDYVVSSSGTIGRIAEVHEEDLPCMLNTSVIRMRPGSERLDRRFLYYFLKSPLFQDQIRSFAAGSAQLNYGPSHLRQMTVSVPPLTEQVSMIEEFAQIDNAHAAIVAEQAGLTTLRSALSAEIFGDAS